jgi:hypothetical protein
MEAAVFSKHPNIFGKVTKEDFLDMYNIACTRVIGWGMPSPMLVPLVDFVNHSEHRESRIDILQDFQSTQKVKLAISSYKRRINLESGVQTDFSAKFTFPISATVEI